MKRKSFKSLNRKLLSYVAWNSLALLLLATSISFAIQHERAKINTLSKLNQLLDTVESTATVAAYSKNEQIAEEVLKGLMKNDIVHKVIISSKGGFNLEQERDKMVNNEAVLVRPIYSLFDKDEIVGHMHIQPCAEYSLKEAVYDTIANVISSFALISVTAIVILWVMRKYISRPITLVSNTLNKIRDGNEHRIAPLKNNANDELGQLRVDINNLVAELEHELQKEYGLRRNIESMEQKLRHMYNSSSAGLFSLNLDGTLLSSNSALRMILNISDEGDWQVDQSYLFVDFIEKHNDFQALINLAVNSGQLESQDFALVRKNGESPVWVHCLLSQITTSNGHTNLEGVLFDVTRRVEAERMIKHEAAHDALTGLLRREEVKSIFENLQNAEKCCFLMMDLDGFKQANDTYGHLAGDQVLKIVSARLTQCVRSSDTVCRLGGDEFFIILSRYSERSTVLDIAENIVTSIQKPMGVGNNVIISIGISVGVVDFITDSDIDFDSMLKKSDEAMYEVKRRGKNGYCIENVQKEMVCKFFGIDFNE